jgi:peptidoglycan/xylan/chitin deacetylase (PgdA/CDA1 family)
MKRYTVLSLAIAGTLFLFIACNRSRFGSNRSPDISPSISPEISRLSQEQTAPSDTNTLTPANQQLKDMIICKYQNLNPTQWGEHIPGVITKINTREKVIALTFDACGNPDSLGYDKDLIDYLVKENIPATLFINARWIDANHDTFMQLATNPLFEIENHGYLHKPLSVTGKSAYDILGTRNAGEVADEVLLNNQKIENLTDRKPVYFRTGTAYYDEVAVKIIYDLGLKPIGFDTLGDAGGDL